MASHRRWKQHDPLDREAGIALQRIARCGEPICLGPHEEGTTSLTLRVRVSTDEPAPYPSHAGTEGPPTVLGPARRVEADRVADALAAAGLEAGCSFILGVALTVIGFAFR